MAVARLGRAHGVRGAIDASPLFDGDPAMLVGVDLWLVDADGQPRAITATHIRSVDSSRWRIELQGIETREDARALVGSTLEIASSDLPSSSPDSPYHFELIGMRVVDRQGREIGVVRRIEELPAGDALALDEAGEVLIPFRPMVVAIDRQKRELVVDVPDGLLEVNR